MDIDSDSCVTFEIIWISIDTSLPLFFPANNSEAHLWSVCLSVLKNRRGILRKLLHLFR